MAHPPRLTFAESLNAQQRRAFYERHQTIAVAMIVAVFLLPFVGLYITGPLGVVLGVGVSVLAYFFTPYVVTSLYED